MTPSFNMVDGELIPIDDLHFREDGVVTGVVDTGVVVHPGVALVVAGVINGSLDVAETSRVDMRGVLNGSLNVGDGAHVIVAGSISGSINVSVAGALEIATGAEVFGSMHVDGRVENHGTRAGVVSGSGLVQDMPGSTVKVGVERNGITYYS